MNPVDDPGPRAAAGAPLLLNPGPVTVDPRVRQAAADVEMCHREPECIDMMTRVRRLLVDAGGGTAAHSAVLLTGSGTAVLEATVSSVVPDGGKLLVVSNGHYGERIAAIAALHRLPHEVLDFGWARPLDLERVARSLRGGAVTHVAAVHHETSSGILNPLDELAGVVHAAGASLIVDAVSSIGGELLDIAGGPDWCVGTANKCIEAIPGISFVLAAHDAFRSLASVPPRSLYLDVHREYVAQEVDGAPRFTPAVQVLHALEAALELLAEETVAGRVARYRSVAGQLRAGLEELGLTLTLPAELRSSTLTTVDQPAHVGYETLHDRMKAAGFVIYPGQGPQRGDTFRLANMGCVGPGDIARFLRALRAVLDEEASRSRIGGRYEPAS